MDLSTRYKIKGIGKEQIIDSVVNIYTNSAGKITMVEDRWSNQLPEGAFGKASWAQIFSISWWFNYYIAWIWWLWSFLWWTWPWLVRFHIRLSMVTFCEFGHGY
jgi:hypothetical protein